MKFSALLWKDPFEVYNVKLVILGAFFFFNLIVGLLI